MSNRLNIVQIQTALLVPITAQFIENKLGIPPTEKEKRAVFWKVSDYAAICDRLATYVKQRRDIDVTKISGERPKSPSAEPAASNDDGGFDFGDEPAAESNDDGFDFGEEPQAEAEAEGFF